MQANREAYEQGLAEERAIRERRGREDGSGASGPQGQGPSDGLLFADESRPQSRWLEVPAYLCEGGDVVVRSR